MQPESSIDVWAPFFSNQMWVIELLARSIPPTHKLLVKIHKSDIANHSREQLERMRALPGVELVAPFVDTRNFIERANLLILIQGTMGLEAALLGKPVIMLGESPVARFPSVSQVGEIAALPSLVRRKLTETPPSRTAIAEAFAEYLAPFLPASPNNWTVSRDAQEVDGYVDLFQALKQYLDAESGKSCRKIV
jgi:lipid A disaccharide synthetase